MLRSVVMARLVCKTFCNVAERLTGTQTILNLYQKHVISCLSLVPRTMFHCTSRKSDLMEFFDSKDNWGEPKVVVGRPWKPDELRIKSNTDLHKLWYVLLKERNMLMTMEAQHQAEGELFPNPERLEKVEESMENILDVVAERNRAFNLLETGKTGEPEKRWVINELGLGYWRREREHYIPIELNTAMRNRTKLAGPWQNKYLRLWREQQVQLKRKENRREKRRLEKLKKDFPDAELD